MKTGAVVVRLWLAGSLVSLVACQAALPANSVPREAAGECAKHCGTLGMTLSAMVVIANMTGCVCEPTGKRSATAQSEPGGAVAAGGAAIAVAIQQQQQGQQPRPPGK